MNLYSYFSIPLLIYDDKCSSCTKFAKTANTLSRGRIRIAGHYYSQEAIEAKKLVFPTDYDSTKMFWMINKKGAYGARSGLIQVIKEIIIGWFKGNESIKKDKNNSKNNNYNDNDENNNSKNYDLSCEYDNSELSCGSQENTLKRIINMMKNSGRFEF
jgi:hypothetical protein